MKRAFSYKERNSKSRKEKKVALIVSEGNNVTETTYFTAMQRLSPNYRIAVTKAGHATDPDRLTEALKSGWDRLELSAEEGDIGFVIVDLDCDEKKANKLKTLMSQNSFFRYIVSNPCFEVWFLLHFRFSTASFPNGAAVVKELRKHLSEYEKTNSVWPVIRTSTERAIDNAYSLEKHFNTLGYRWPSNECNPRTDVHHAVSIILGKSEVTGNAE